MPLDFSLSDEQSAIESAVARICERFGDDYWLEPLHVCRECEANSVRDQRGEVLKRIIPEHLQACCRDYRAWNHRQSLDRALQAWIESDCGRGKGTLTAGGRPVVLVWGGPGSGKSVGLVRYLTAAYYSLGLVKSVYYATEEQLLRAASTEWVRDKATGAPVYPEARERLDWVHQTEFDELQDAVAALTERVAALESARSAPDESESEATNPTGGPERAEDGTD